MATIHRGRAETGYRYLAPGQSHGAGRDLLGCPHDAAARRAVDRPPQVHLQRLPLQGEPPGLPPAVQEGVTVLLPKTVGAPQTWGDTRPITLFCAVLK